MPPPVPMNHERQLSERICNPWPNRSCPIPQPTGHMSPPFTRASRCPRAPCEGAEKLPNHSFSSHSVADSGLTGPLPILLYCIMSDKRLYIRHLHALFTHISRDIQNTRTDRFSMPNARFKDLFQLCGTSAGDANAASPELLGSSGGTVPRLTLGARGRSERPKFWQLRLQLHASL
jgi:hypothetical protein